MHTSWAILLQEHFIEPQPIALQRIMIYLRTLVGQATCNDALKLILKGGTVYTNCPTITLQPCLHSEGQCLQGRRNSLASGGLELATSLAMPSGVLGPRGEHLHRSSRGVCKPDHVAKYCRHFFCHLTATATVFPRCMHADVYGYFCGLSH